MLNNLQNRQNYEKNNGAITLAEAQNPQVVPIKAGFTQFEVINAIYDSKILSEVKLTAGARLVLISLARHYNPSNDEFFPSYTCIASHTGVSKKSVERAIKELVSAGLITYRTERVNRYRFTGRFFASVKLSVAQRQNDESGYGQNVAQTNNHEKRKNNEKVLNFSFKASLTASARNEQCAQVMGLNGGVINDEKNDKNDDGLVGGKRARAGQNDGYVSETQPSARASASSNERTFVSTGNQKNQTGGNAYRGWGSSSKFGGNSSSSSLSGARYTVPPSERKGGSSFTPSVSRTDEYLKEVRIARQNACSPLEFDFERAKRWYCSLSTPLRGTALAQRVLAKYPTILD